jgi:arginine-tRNA-protein transferase
LSDSGQPNRDDKRLELFLSAPHPCNYLPDQHTVNLVADPRITITTPLYSALVAQGFRRSGEFTYRPHCPHCDACVSLRLPVAEFRPRRSQRRVLKRNQDVSLHPHPADFNPAHFALYRRYVNTRHPDGGMDNPEQADFLRFLTAAQIDTTFYELREADALLGVAVVDRLRDGLSAVYTFFDPDLAQRSLGGLAILLLIDEAQRLGLQYLYLGYWIDGCDKMHYKTEYQPAEGFIDSNWRRLPTR